MATTAIPTWVSVDGTLYRVVEMVHERKKMSAYQLEGLRGLLVLVNGNGHKAHIPGYGKVSCDLFYRETCPMEW